jgi:regulator of replication initiation timing
MVLTILLIIALIAVGVFVATKYFGAFTDKDKNGIPDHLEEKVAEVKVKVSEVKQDVQEVVAETKLRVQKVKQEASDVVKAAKEVVKQSQDVVKAATTKTTARKGRKPKK